MASPDTYKRRPVSIYIVKREAIDIKRRTHRRRTAPTLTPKLSKIIKALKTAKTGKTIKRLRNYRLPRGIRPLRRLRLRAKVLNVATAVLVSLILIVIVNMVFNGAPAKKNIAPADVSAFRIPPASLTALWDLSEKYGLDFTELLTVYALDNDFFPERSAAVPTTAEIEIGRAHV
jgi:hypothetical protein